MRPPATINLKIALRDALIFETAFLQKPPLGGVLRQTGRLDPAKVKPVIRVMHHGIDRLAHIALPRMALPDPVSQRSRLRRAAPDIVQRDRPKKGLVFTPDKEKRQGRP